MADPATLRPPLVLCPPALQPDDAHPLAHCWTVANGRPWCLIHRMPSGYRMRFPGLADFHLHRDGSIEGIPTPETDLPTLQHLFANQVLPAALSLQQRPVFHASALAMHGAGVAFLGESGRGKSTLATFLARRGHPLLTDDGLELHMDAIGGLWAIPNQPSVRLWEDSRTALLPAEAVPQPAVAYTRKERFQADTLLPCATAPVPLRAAFFLGDGSATHPTITMLTPQQAHLAWVRHAFLLDPHDTSMMTWLFQQVAHLARAGISYQLDYPRRYSMLPDVETALLAALQLPSPHTS